MRRIQFMHNQAMSQQRGAQCNKEEHGATSEDFLSKESFIIYKLKGNQMHQRETDTTKGQLNS